MQTRSRVESGSNTPDDRGIAKTVIRDADASSLEISLRPPRVTTISNGRINQRVSYEGATKIVFLGQC